MNIVIIGGAGFIGINAASFYLEKGDSVTILDNFSRKGARNNIQWLSKQYKNRVKVIEADIRKDFFILKTTLTKADIILHLAAQVAVTSSVMNPRDDFEINALGTFNVLEAIRISNNNPVLLFSSTNKVYGHMKDIRVVEKPTRYAFEDLPGGIDENYNLDFHSPYGCSKGAADQYVRDYSRIYGLHTIVFRQSCIYGPHQFGVEDQGWVAWFMIALVTEKKITIYGNGKQVRDILYVGDLIEAYDSATRNIEVTKGQIYNIGGGEKNTMSIWLEFKPILDELFRKDIKVDLSDWRPGDQSIFVSNIEKAKKDFNWHPKTGIKEGIGKLFEWVNANKGLFYT